MSGLTSVPGERERISLYVRVASGLRSRISEGEWKAGDRLPSIKDLAKEYDVAIVTLRGALGILAEDGLVVSNRGLGTFVRSEVKALKDDPGLRAAINDRVDLSEGQTIRILERRTTATFPADFAPDAGRYRKYVEIRKLHLHNNEPFALISVFLAKQIYDLFPPRADEATKLLRLVFDYAKPKLRSSRIQLTLAYADRATATLLECEPTAALVRTRSWRVDESGRLAFGHVSLYRGDRFIFDIVEHDTDLTHSNSLIMPGTQSPATPAGPKRHSRKLAK